MKRHIPNLITLMNVFCGSVATVFAVLNQLELAAFFVFLGIIFDFFDGMAARILNVKSELGLQLDSLADVITSGLVPGIVMFQLLAMSMNGGWNVSLSSQAAHDTFWVGLKVAPLPFLGFVITLASAYRLAKFNIDENQTSSFIGLPTPANALLILSLPLILLYQNNDILNGIILNQWFLIGMTILSAYLLNSKIELFALKFKNWNFKDNSQRYIFLIVSLVLLLTMKYLAIPAIIVFYILSSAVGNVSKKA
ncbi:CDP-alcohol phosphatidyltransferase family protein [Maribacter polysiphoniae]|uniref:CDP-alcohol phosphatidyltransferase family protein n=1 Tax=Maribacter polysiphoniae TaxID=429344 RepID=A0A316E3Q1_9FLAO|nr:CDP-alcohol phosphatidyltransferase family protein [Maribacter polysiphoniae]MBD1259119.1 CDP-alcohol phosphatidyltransferase family protein [Maribacter polysiphoniae]PWK24675.1 CDP-diacylglycerol--serine O-phosphatidyltransferase [Maribacter polysiphoniae]